VPLCAEGDVWNPLGWSGQNAHDVLEGVLCHVVIAFYHHFVVDVEDDLMSGGINPDEGVTENVTGEGLRAVVNNKGASSSGGSNKKPAIRATIHQVKHGGYWTLFVNSGGRSH
jgi:hypothetical protein